MTIANENVTELCRVVIEHVIECVVEGQGGGGRGEAKTDGKYKKSAAKKRGKNKENGPMVRRVATGSIYLTRGRVERRLADRIKTSSESTDDVLAFGVFAAAAAHLSCVQTRNLTASSKKKR